MVDEGFVIVEPNEVKTKAQPSTGRKEYGRSRRWCWWLGCGTRSRKKQSRACGCKSREAVGVGGLNGERRLLVLGDGATWIRTWFEGLGICPKAMILCWWHLRKRCYEQMSSAGGPKDRRRAFEKELLGQLGRKGGCGDRTSQGDFGVGEESGGGGGTDRVPGEAARVYPRLPTTETSGVMDREHTGGEIQRRPCRDDASIRG